MTLQTLVSLVRRGKFPASVVSTVFLGAAVLAAPSLFVETTEIDLGTIRKGETARVEFVLENRGDEELEILSAEPGCGCTLATWDRTIAAGETGKITAELSTENLIGDVGKGIAVKTNDPRRPLVMLVINAEIFQAVRILPEDRVVLRNYRDGGVSQRLLRREMSARGDLDVSELRSSVPWIEARARPLRDKEPHNDFVPRGFPGDWVVELALTAEAPYGQGRQTVELATGLPGQETATIHVFADVQPPVDLPKQQVVLTPVAREQMLILSVRKGLDPEKLKARATPDALEVRLESGGGAFHKAFIRFDGDRLDDGKVVFEIGSERHELPVRYVRE